MSVTTGLRILSHIAHVRPTDECEMGDDDGCGNRPAYWLTAEASYVKPMILCAAHAEEEHVGYGTSIPAPVGSVTA